VFLEIQDRDIGALAAGLLDIAVDLTGEPMTRVSQAVFVFYAAVGAVVLMLYSRLPQPASTRPAQPQIPLRQSRRIVLTLAALFSLDSFAGGFVVQSMLALWLFERFGLSLTVAGAIFFWTGVLSALSYFAAVQVAEQRYGQLDILVNNAGVVHVAPVVDETDDGWHNTMAVNATGVFYGMRAAIPALGRAGGGSIINVASIYGPVGAPHYIAYTASKGAVIAMTKVAALEHADHGIRVNAICPGPVRSPMSEQEGDASVDVTPLRRCAEPEEVSSAVAFLASDDAIYITGTELAIDGGYLAR